MEPGTQCIINKTWRMLSAGTRVTVLSEDHGYVNVQMTTRPGKKLIDNGVPYMGIFDIERDYLTPIRQRVDIVEKSV